MRMLVFTAFMVLSLSGEPAETPDSRLELQRKQMLDFYGHLDTYLRKLYGCPTNNRPIMAPSECRPASGTLDLVEFNHVRETAKRALGLTEPRTKKPKSRQLTVVQ